MGKSLPQDLAYGKVTGSAVYCGDMRSVGMLHIKLKRSTIAHAWVEDVFTEEAEKMPGVKAVYTFKNTPDKNYDRGRVSPTEDAPTQEKLFDRHIRFYGERVAAVVAVSEEAAEAACEKIRVTYKELPAAISVEAAMAEDAPKLHEEGNVRTPANFNHGDYDSCEAPLVHHSKTHIDRMSCLAMETHVCRALYDKASGKLTVWTPCQTAFGIRSTLADYLEMPYSKVRVIKSLMGGSFGYKQETLLEPLAAYAAVQLKADVKFVYSREEDMVNTMMRHSLDAWVESKVHPDGTIEGTDIKVIMDAGAYQTITPSYCCTIGKKTGKVYRIPNLRFVGSTVCTNTPVNGSFRSWGGLESVLIMENHWNMVARDLGIDPVEFRLKNVHKPYEEDTFYHVSVGNARFEEVLTRGRDAFRWEERKTECKRKNAAQDRYRYGVGMSVASHTSSFYPYLSDNATAAARIQDDGSLIVNVGIHDHGCGTVLAMKKIAAEVMEIDLEKVELKEMDTDVCMYDYGCYASRTVYVLGHAVKLCCEKLLEKAAETAANYFRCPTSWIRYEDGEFWRENQPDEKLSLADVENFAVFSQGKDIYMTYTYNSVENPGPAAAHFDEVEVDTYSGQIRVVDCLSVHDIGKAINPDLCRGQVGSGVQQGMGIALCEEIKIDPVTGKTLIDNLKNYEVANAWDMPDYQVIFVEEPEENGPFGAKSIGEVAVTPVAPAMVAAVNDALGTNLTTLPLTPSVILEAVAGGKE